MKQKLFVLATAMLLSLSTIYAQEQVSVPAFMVKHLNDEFKEASNVQWRTVDMFYKATFLVDGNQLDAYFTFDAKLTAVARKLKVEQLPLALIKEVKEKAMYYSISELFELLTDNGTEYFLSLSDEKGTKTYRSLGDGWMRY